MVPTGCLLGCPAGGPAAGSVITARRAAARKRSGRTAASFRRRERVRATLLLTRKRGRPQRERRAGAGSGDDGGVAGRVPRVAPPRSSRKYNSEKAAPPGALFHHPQGVPSAARSLRNPVRGGGIEPRVEGCSHSASRKATRSSTSSFDSPSGAITSSRYGFFTPLRL